MKPLYKVLSCDNKIYDINKKTLEEAVIEAFNHDKYKFYLNSELIDVNDRFRIFNFQDDEYIVKKTSFKNGENELKLATMGNKYLHNLNVNGFNIKVVVPLLIKTGNEAYIITEYKGVTLQECMYSNEIKNPIEIDDLIDILRKFVGLGILHRGLSPRNIIISNRDIYLVDWEDTIFCDHLNDSCINSLWETNLLLDWSYFYPFDELKSKLLQFRNNSKPEPDLVTYEKEFRKWIGWKESDISLRRKIMDTVLFAEKKINSVNDEFCITPSDMAGIVSDLFNYDIDVLFDISCYLLRQKNETIHNKAIVTLSKLIISLYKRNIKMQPYVIMIFLMILELAISNKQIIINMEFYNETQLLHFLKNEDYKLVISYIENDVELFNIQLKSTINQLIKQFNNADEEIIINTDNLSKYVLSLRNLQIF